MINSIRFCLFILAAADQTLAEDAHVTLWVRGLGSEKPASKSELKVKPNETAYLVSWLQDEFRPTFITIWSGNHDTIIIRKPEVEIDQKTKSVIKNGSLPLPALVVAGPATLELSMVGQATAFCTFRIVQGTSRTVETTDNAAPSNSNQVPPSEQPSTSKEKQ